MSLALYLNSSIFPVIVNREDISGKLPTTVSIDAGSAFVGDANDPLVVAALAAGRISLIAADPSNYMSTQLGLVAGTVCEETVGPMFNLLATSLTSLLAAPTSLALVSGNGQTATAGTALASPFVVVVKTASGAPVSGIVVAWAVTAGGGSLSATSTITNGSGQASVTLTLGAVAGSNTATAAASGAAGALTGSPVTFTATGT